MFRYLCSIFDPLRFRDRKRPAIAWLTHFYDPQAQIAFGRLAKEAAGCGQVYQFRDGLEVRKGESRRQILSLSEDEIAAASPYRYAQWKDKLEAGEHVGGHVDIVIMAIAKRLSAHDHIWIIESDVDFTGDWASFFSAFSDNNADLLGTSFYPHHLSEEWFHWRNFEAPDTLADENRTRGFFPVARLSQRFIRTFLDEVQAGWDGHYEALWPTIARHHGLKFEDIGGYGPMTPEPRKGKWYTGSSLPKLNEGSFRYRPPVSSKYYPDCDADLPQNQLCHPIKTAVGLGNSDDDRPREQKARLDQEKTGSS